MAKALIEYKNASIYHNEDLVLEGVDFTISEGEFVYFIGKVGSGKSSLLRTFYAELDLDDADTCDVLGRNMLKIKRKEVQKLRRELGIVFQNFRLLTDRTVEKNLEFVLKATGWKNEDIPARIKEVLESVGMLASLDKKPYELSGGEQQRIAIARALLNSPKILLADEPTGNLDPEAADNIVALLRDITSTGTAVIMTTHNLPMLDKYPGIVYEFGDHKLKEITNEYNK